MIKLKKKEFNKLFFRFRLTHLAWFLTKRQYCFAILTNNATLIDGLFNEKHPGGIKWSAFTLTRNFYLDRYFPLASNIALLTWENAVDFRYFMNEFLIEQIVNRNPVGNNVFFNLFVYKGRFYSLEDFLLIGQFFQHFNFNNKSLFAHDEFLRLLNYLVVKHGLLTVFQRFYLSFFKQQLFILNGYLQTSFTSKFSPN